MNYLIDTHILIWALTNTVKLSKRARQVLAERDVQFFFSPASVWEEALPEIHSDPIDRLLVAQAKVEAMSLVTHDGKLAAYGDNVIPV